MMTYSGDKLRAVIDQQGRRVAWLAARTGLHFSTIYRFMDGSRSLSEEQARKLATVLDVPLEALEAEQETANAA